jgi:flagellar L-ring protein FlgH
MMKWTTSVMVITLLAASSASAADLYSNSDWTSLASDRNAHRVGDLLTVIVYESATATNTATNSSRAASNIGGQVSAGSAFSESASLGLAGSSEHSGTTERSGGIVAQISVVVDEVLPNGDLRVSGRQLLNINDERTEILIKGRVRQVDISTSNTVLSSRLADAVIKYDGSGFVSRSARPGIVTRIFTWLGLP